MGGSSWALAEKTQGYPVKLYTSLLVAITNNFRHLTTNMAYGKGEQRVATTQGKCWGIFICWLLGNGCLFGFNSMLTIEDYYTSLFPNYHPTRVVTLTYQPFVLGTTAIFTYHEAKVNTRLRNLAGYTLFFLSSFAAIILDVATSGRGGIAPFVGVCIIAAAFGVADGHVQGGMTGDLSLMCPEFIQSFFAGLAASGMITSALRLITKAAFENSRDGLRKGAMLFSSISCFFELLCVLLYAFIFPKLPIVKFYRSKAASEGSLTVAADLAAGGIQNRANSLSEEDPSCVERLSTKQLLLQNTDYALDLFLIYLLTLSIFPGFLAENTGSHSLGSWYALVLIASYNVWDLIGRYIPLIEQVKLRSRKVILIAVVSRFLLIPAFYYTAKYSDQGWMIMLTSFLGLSNGYLTVCILTEAPKGYKGPEQNALGNLLVLSLLGGIFCGAILDWLWLIGKGW
uniref:Equilibrative nucleoside transporter n=1 Tax=Oryza barthii TaxID=65489 RepID=A0A0D3GSB4_9ORYZ